VNYLRRYVNTESLPFGKLSVFNNPLCNVLLRFKGGPGSEFGPEIQMKSIWFPGMNAGGVAGRNNRAGAFSTNPRFTRTDGEKCLPGRLKFELVE
jgi:hypothetical protein